MPAKFVHEGICVGPLTPMLENGDVNLEAIPNYVDHLVRNNVNAVFVNGTTAEGLSLTIAERKTLAEKWMQASRNKLRVILHCGAIALREAQELAAHGESIGVDAIAAIPSFFFPPRNAGELVRSVAEIASAAPNTPFIYYHTPRAHLSLDMNTFISQAREKIPTFAGIKWADDNAADAYKCFVKHGSDIQMMWARDDCLLSALTMGINSFNGSSYTFTAPIARRVIDAFQRGDQKTADSEMLKLKKVVDVLEKNGDWLPRHKAAANMIGFPMGPTRSPVQPLSDQEYKQLFQELTELGYFDWIKN